MDAPKPKRTRSYKELRLQQLRSFAETARLGSLAAAARSLGLAQPTVWEQVHALEREFGVPLVETHGQGCRLTDDGRLLAELSGPLVASIDGLPARFLDARGTSQKTLNIATTPRSLMEDFPDCVLEFENRFPQVRAMLMEDGNKGVWNYVLREEAEIGFTPSFPEPGEDPPLDFEVVYELELFLITPKNHPLARKKLIKPEDLVSFPLVNSAHAFSDHTVAAALKKMGMFDSTTRKLACFFTASIRHYVKLGFGIGLVSRLPDRAPDPELHERSMSRYLGSHKQYAVTRKGCQLSEAAQAFKQIVIESCGGKARTPITD
jgi:molybdate transport repressor ModE-like protein